MIINSDGTRISREDFLKRCNSVSSYIAKYHSSQKLIIYYRQPIDIIYSLFACINIGKIAIPISTKTPPRSLEQHAQYTKCDTILSDDNISISNCNIVNYKDLDLSASDSTPLFQNLDFDSVSTVILSSGSTGKPKYVCSSLNNHYYSAMGSREHIPFYDSSKWLLSLPLNHIGGISILFKIYFYGCGEIVILNKKMSILENINSREITHCSLVPTQLKMLCEEIEDKPDEYPKSLQYILVGGAAVSVEIKRIASRLSLPVLYSYGSSEMSSQICTSKLNDGEHSCGKPLKYRDLRISEEGEIMVKGECLFKGYLQENGELRLSLNDGWFATNDYGKLDEQGNLVPMCRRDSMIICGGENIFPREIELELNRIQQIAKSQVIAVPDAYFGEVPIAKVETTSPISKEEIMHLLSLNLPKYKLPKELIFTTIDDNQSSKDRRIIDNLLS